MKSVVKSGLAGFAIGLSVAAVGAQAAVHAPQHEHSGPTGQTPPADAMKNTAKTMGGMEMHAMMADPAMRQKMLADMAQCRDMMSTMMAHMEQEGMKKDAPAPHK